MPDNSRSYKRRTIFIKQEFQFKFILKFCLLLVVGVIISTSLLFLLSQETLTSSFENSRLVIKNTGSAILPSVIVTNLITLGIICIAAIIVTLFISHRIAGPMYRFEKDLCKIEDGDLCTHINLRQKDQFSEMALALNDMTKGLHHKVSRVNNGLDEILSTLENDDKCKGCRQSLEDLKTVLQKEFSL
ncbi:MAG: methyl-accepting chemotaxis protein [Desulfobacteraceae bacterium]|nr:methyl-accepting chemotaxis protein [Desulfobacteraceae bacterium]